MTSAGWYLALILAVVAERICELLLTRRNAARMVARGGFAAGDGHYPLMVILHTALLVGAPLEVFLLSRPFVAWLGWPMLALVFATMALRYWAISTLGDRWTTRIFVVPGEPPVVGGPYRWVRHPNYLAVILEVAALPLVHTAWLTAVFGSLANAFVLRARIRAEEAALSEASSYREKLGDRPRFLPGAAKESR
jgi:methyltransferase